MTERYETNSRIQGQKPGVLAHPHIGVVVCVVLCAAIFVMAAGLLAGCGSETLKEPSKEVQAMLQDRFEAMNAGDTQAIAKCYTSNAVLDNYADFGANVQGATAIAEYLASVFKDLRMQWKAEGGPVQHDRYVIQRVSMSQLDGTGTGAAVHVLQVDSNGQIEHEWVVGWAAE
jgi:ketosteroid isomerase-like protein